MHTRKILSACGILLVPIVIWGAVLLIGGRSIPRDELDEDVATYRIPYNGGHFVISHNAYKIIYKGRNFAISQEVEMDINGMNFGGIAALAIIGALVGIFSTLFWMFIGWRVLKVLEKLSTTFDRLLQQKIADNQEQDGDTE